MLFYVEYLLVKGKNLSIQVTYVWKNFVRPSSLSLMFSNGNPIKILPQFIIPNVFVNTILVYFCCYILKNLDHVLKVHI